MSGTGSGITFLGHAMTRVELAGASVVTDPLLRSRVAFLRWVAPAPQVAAPDAVLVSHLHQDHCDLPSLRRLGPHTALVVPCGTERFFARHGFGDVVALRPGESHDVGPLQVTATPADHDGRRRPAGRHGPLAVGYVVSGAGRRVYFAGDTGLFPQLAGIGPGLDAALLPVAGWHRTLGPGHLDPRTAAEAVRLLAPRVAVPVHWGALRPAGQRRAPQVTTAPAREFAAEVALRAPEVAVAVLRPGEHLPLG